MKKCNICKVEKDLSSFHKKKINPDGLSYRCKECAISNSKKHYLKNKDAPKERAFLMRRVFKECINEIKSSKKCFNCNCNVGICLDFHHFDERAKENNVSYFVEVKNLNKVYNELLKCIVTCANCHRMIHAGLLNPTEDKIIKISFDEFKELIDKYKVLNGLNLEIKRPRKKKSA